VLENGTDRQTNGRIAALFNVPALSRRVKVKKVKFSHTRYRALGLELIPVYR